ncbi:MAG: PAS domain S-box protein, partial [Steroidobacteraceae bacterium]
MSAEPGAPRQLALLRAILRDLSVPIIVVDRDARLLFLNASALRLLQCTQDIVGGPISSVLALVNSQLGLSIDAIIAHVVREGLAAATAWKADLVTTAGRQIPVELVTSALSLDEEGTAGVTLTLRDRTDEQDTERRVQRLLEKSESEREWFSLVLNSIADEVYFTDTDARYTYANPAALREFGHASVEGTEVAKVIE